ncbi:N-terminal double-transmembrane domain-containing protein [Bradyrhizobium erythrophlei]|uniref:N-terminal double-transmembrane domain-containing protein n=2 Tax=Bradyrhizobium erythrophlei TaxID=1437360 RepID=A0A1M5JK98_9BRAD|nr:N-terminal double-transmembrane domain-containing protein [Bradyrhizobium erythrophlei]
MMAGLPLSFTEPMLLLGLLSLPVLWWLLRVMPPRPRRIEFPPTRLLFDIAPKEETPSRTPWWLTALRLLAAALLILAAAGPVWNPQTGLAGSRAPLVILLDDGWSAASSWDTRVKAADELIANADNDRRGVALVPLSEPSRDITLMTGGTARVALRQLTPKPYSIERVETLPAIQRFLKATGDCEIAWLSDGVDTGRGPEFLEGLSKTIGDRALTIFEGGTPPPLALVAAENAAAKMTVKVLRADGGGVAAGIVRALDLKGSPIGEARFTFAPQDRETEAAFDLPVELRNDIARLEISGERSAGAVQLLDKRWRRRAIGIVSGSSSDTAQPLLASTFYLTRALAPFADVRLGDRGAPQQAITQFLDQKLPMIVLADVGTLSPEIRERISAWIEQGGVLVRFAGPRLAQADDDLVPVKLRRGGRSLGGSLTWEKPQHLASFAADGPFAGLTAPKDVTVNRQVLAEPDAVLATKSWASLEDGTPLVTGERRGKGVVSLFHVSADMRWSDLPMSGSFVEMLRRIVDMSGYTSNPGAGVASQAAAETVAPLHILDGFGSFGPPPSTAKPLPADFRDRATPDHPPGFYGPADGPLAVNTLAAADRIAPLDTSGLRARRASYTNAEPRDLRGMLLSSSLALFLIDAIVVALLGAGFAALLRRRAVSAALVFAFLFATMLGAPSPSRADGSDDFAIKATSQTRLAYVVTGNADVDSIVKAGMSGLTLFLAQRTALEAGDPVGVDPAHDELAFFPLIYWPVVPGAAKPPQDAINRIDAYMKQGGTVLFDTRDAIEAPPGDGGASQTPGMLALRNILSSLDVPELEPVPREHVLTKTFYLLRDFPGRFNTGQTWVETLPREDDDEAASRPARGGDGVSPIIITSNDLAGAWAIRPDGQPMLPLTPGEPRQREFAFRAGVNIVMYTLTGNYKADQVHAPALIERLGQ